MNAKLDDKEFDKLLKIKKKTLYVEVIALIITAIAAVAGILLELFQQPSYLNLIAISVFLIAFIFLLFHTSKERNKIDWINELKTLHTARVHLKALEEEKNYPQKTKKN
ncbi:hypothetical protein AMET1_0533 [Methanonatronarchaeum thermophilum]|uniref:Uncharacterized protein n=1 Tax=Methanonatronarchaeum thermophilum TaxID=1927129 RepID=A0A1Y3GBP9_9EURY|nr:hypothetical protein [Methanonatronarchaeum thermophilum]OUJ18882.1 hypothetical protein AMET1_0533 [Methanonatronarchaeum thermophilum]